MRIFNALIIAVIIGFVSISSPTIGQNNLNDIWQKTSKSALSEKELINNYYPTENTIIYQLDINALRASVANAPLRGTNSTSSVVVSFPISNGTFESFRIMEAPVLHPDLAARYPGIKSYVGKGINNPSSIVRFSLSNEKGLSSMIISGTRNTEFIAPYTHDLSSYIVYNRTGRTVLPSTFECLTEDTPYEFKKGKGGANDKDATDQTLRTFRLAMSGSGEYTAYHGGTKASALAAMNTTMTRVNGVYEIDFAITMILIANNDDVIYTNAGSDPYTSNLNNQLQTTLTSVIGESNYDIGHLVHRDNDNGNAGCIGCVCVNNQKGSAFTSHMNPQGDFFDIDYVAHEMGHQYGANHTHTYTGFSEGTGAQMEPGSGSTIMGYAGITGASSDVQAHSDDYFHYFNIEQVTNYVSGTSCQTETPIANNPPSAAAGSNYTIPYGTAFILEGQGSDADAGDVLTYCWEQANVGFDASNGVSATSTSSPNFRSFPPTTSPDRYMPALTSVVAGNLSTTWETVSNVGRTMNFALTVRDNVAGGGQNSIDQMIVNVDGGIGPFVVTSQGSAVTWNGGTSETVTWNVAGTNGGAVNTANVDIFLSLDGGFTYPITLASNVPNDGSESVTVPNNPTSQARVMVRGAGNIFYAINSSNFTVAATQDDFTLDVPNDTISVCSPNDAVFTVNVGVTGTFTDPVTLSAVNLPAGAIANFSTNPVNPSGTSTMTITNIGAVTPGWYGVGVEGTSTSGTKNFGMALTIADAAPSAATLSTPADAATGIAIPTAFAWNAVSGVGIVYDIDIATDAGFSTIVDNATGLTTNSYNSTGLSSATTYYWRVTARNACGTAPVSSTFSFETNSCSIVMSTDVPVTISQSGTPTITSTLNFALNGTIQDVNVVNLTGQHTWINDLTVTLESPQGTVVTLWDQICGNENDFDVNFDDGAAAGPLPCPPVGGGTYQPDGSLGSFNGENANGTWTLSITDNANFDGGSLDTWGVEICTAPIITNIEDNSLTEVISLYPNPTSNMVTINFTNPELINNLVLMDVQGKLIYQSNNISNNRLEVDLSDQSKGIYMLRVESKDEVKVFKVLKQ